MPDHDLHGVPGRGEIRRAYRSMIGGFAAVAQVLLPPQSFGTAEVERTFQMEHARLSGPQRRIGILLALLFWMAYSSVDYMNVGPGSGADTLFPKILFLRVLGTVAIVSGAFLASRPRFLEDEYSNRLLLIFAIFLYLLLLGMVAAIDFPYSYVIDCQGLILYLLFVLGLLKIRAKTFLWFITIVFPISVLALYYADVASAEQAEAFSRKATSEALPVFSHYYYISSVIYLASSMIVGYAISCQLERDARAAFHRERELDRSNQTLVEARRDIENKTRALIAAKEELRISAERANREKSKFLADAVHDLSQPTQAVSLLAESARLALARNDLGMASDLIELTGRAAKTARSSFQAVLEISRLESGLIKPNLTAFGVQDLVGEAIAPLRVIAQAKGVKIRVRQPRDVRSMTFSDRDLLLRAVANLASNAIKYSDHEKGERQCVLIGVVPLPNRVLIDVIDNGIGIPESKWGEVFKPFVQLQNPEHNREKGLGLGLSIVHAIFAVLPEHRLDMRSAEGRGTRFSLELPRYIGAPISLAEVGASMAGMVDFASLFVWHVEDDEITRVATKALLTELGILVEQAASFEELERELPFTERRPDLVITDYLLPGGRTAEDVIAIFVRKWDADLPIMILTGEVGAVNAETIGSNTALLKKPASATDIVDAIHRLCFKNSSALEVPE